MLNIRTAMYWSTRSSYRSAPAIIVTKSIEEASWRAYVRLDRSELRLPAVHSTYLWGWLSIGSRACQTIDAPGVCATESNLIRGVNKYTH